MHQSFTGSSRRPRQVNLSGRTTNPFAATGSTAGPQAALANAHQERLQRQRERDRLNGARLIQRIWRGYNCRRKLRAELRAEWDAKEPVHDFDLRSPLGTDRFMPYESEADSLSRLRHLLRFVDPRNQSDLYSLRTYVGRQILTVRNVASCSGGPWPMAYLRLQRVVLAALEHVKTMSNVPDLLDALMFLVTEIPAETASQAQDYYQVMAHLTLKTAREQWERAVQQKVEAAVTMPLQAMTARTLNAYEAFGLTYIATGLSPSAWSTSRGTVIANIDPEFPVRLVQRLADNINYKILASALASALSGRKARSLNSTQQRTGLLGCFVYFHRHAHGFGPGSASPSDNDYVTVVSSLLTSVHSDLEAELTTAYAKFLQSQIESLVNQRSIGNLFKPQGTSSAEAGSQGPRLLANYALILLRCFPHRRDEIRMWLYIGSTSSNVSALSYFWQVARSTNVFRIIESNSRAAARLLKPMESEKRGTTTESQSGDIDDDWRVISVFLELYIFVLKVMDDEQFFAAKDNALPLNAVKDLTVFLKNLGFTLYFNAPDISQEERAATPNGLSSYFTVNNAHHTPEPAKEVTTNHSVASVAGTTIDHLKGLVTGLLRMIYERDSRRKFLPKDHWLMTSRLDMNGFIEAVVLEEENRHKVQEEDDQDMDQDDAPEDGFDGPSATTLVGTSRAQRVRNTEALRRQQRKASRKRYLQAVAPRLEILQNMPFFIPFPTRVQIFREFVHLDQHKRRNGFVDPDTWRMSVMHGPHGSRDSLERHHAKIRRKNEFEDAFQQFYPLKDGLKEPIQITFVDQFDTVEAGIDGGGVTKEFLTSVTSQAFSPHEGLNMFITNDQHLLYPNPALMDEQKETLKQAGIKEGSPVWRDEVTGLLQRMEFLGMVVGKCLYEGILVDINFAGFFLLKWALTGGTGSAPNESGYRANLNDLRDMDEALYQGLLQLKNYPGDVEDFSLNFTITDTITTDFRRGTTKTITRELRPGGADIPVTNENRLVYISYVARYRLQVQPFQQTAAFLRGLSSIIQPSWLSMFNQSELQSLISGTSSSISIPDLRRNTQYGGVYQLGDPPVEHPTIQKFWRVMENMTEEEKKAVLKFVTSTPRAPLLGFASLNPRFSIRDAGSDQERLPSTSTCVNLLKLPMYKDEKTLREKLLYAVFSGAGFDLS